jgi:hypothetical protein
MQIRSLCVFAFALATACGPIPGGSLAGERAEIPADWSPVLAGDRAICEIEARPEDPHSIQLECFLYEGALYAQSHRWALAAWWPVTSWAEVWLAHPDVLVRVGSSIYPLTAALVVNAPEREKILGLRGYDPVPAGIALFRFDPRAASAAS